MSNHIICEKIVEILNQILDYNKDLVPKNYTEEFGENLTSIEFVTFIVEVESTFDVEINDDDFELKNLDTVEKISNLVTKYLDAKNN